MRSVRDVAMWIVAVLLIGAQAKAVPDQHTALGCVQIAAAQEPTSGGATQKEATMSASAATGEGCRARSDLMSSARHFEVLCQWHYEVTHLP